MKVLRLLPLLAVLAAGPVPPGAGAQGFEGVVKQRTIMVMPQGVAALAGAAAAGGDMIEILQAVASRIENADPSIAETQETMTSVKGNRYREDAPDTDPGGEFTIVDGASGINYLVVPAAKQVLTGSAADAAELVRSLSASAGSADSATTEPTITALGTRIIRGARAYGYRMVFPTTVSEWWVDPALKTTMRNFQALQHPMSEIAREGAWLRMVRQKGFPIQMTNIARAPAMVGGGWMVVRAEVTSVVKGRVADGLFVVPADYQHVRLRDRTPAR